MQINRITAKLKTVFEDLQLINRVLPLRVFLGSRWWVPCMKRSPPETDLHIPRSAAIFAVFVWSGRVNPRHTQTPEQLGNIITRSLSIQSGEHSARRKTIYFFFFKWGGKVVSNLKFHQFSLWNLLIIVLVATGVLSILNLFLSTLQNCLIGLELCWVSIVRAPLSP